MLFNLGVRVKSFAHRIGDAVLEIVEDFLPVPVNEPSYFLEWLQSTAYDRSAPAFVEALRRKSADQTDALHPPL